MNNFSKLKNMTIDEMADWLEVNGIYNDGPWDFWFLNKYCENCEPVCHPVFNHDASYCELHDEWCCKLEKEVPSPREIIGMWLEADVSENPELEEED